MGADGVTGPGPGGSAGPAATARSTWESALAAARTELSQQNYLTAQQKAEALLRAGIPADVRAGALLVAADAASALRSYDVAIARYGELLADHRGGPQPERARLALGWAQLRQGHREQARGSWVAVADTQPADALAPLALVLAAEVAGQAGDAAGTQRLLDRVLGQYPATPYAGIARLTRSAVALQRGQQEAALRDLDEVVRTNGIAALEERRRLGEALATPGFPPVLTPALVRRAPDDGDPLERFVTQVLDRRRHDATPYTVHGLVLLAAANRGWSDVLTATLARRLLEDFPSYAAAPALLARVATTAAADGQWPVARPAWQTLLARAPAAVAPSARVTFAEALYRGGSAAEAREIAQTVATGREEAPRALRLLADIHEAGGDGERARLVLRRLVEVATGEVAAEAAYRLGQSLRAAGQPAAAVEWYLTAAYVPGGGRWVPPALLGAGAALAANNETKEALAAYRKLLRPRPGAEAAADREIKGEAAYRAGEILAGAGLHGDALAMFTTSANLTAGLRAERRALVGVLRCLVATGDRAGAETIYRRLRSAGAAEPELLAQARAALHGPGAAEDNTGASTLPRAAH